MSYKQVKVDNLLNKITKKDKLFGGKFTIDPYQNCEFGCLYCDSSFDKTIYIKTNAVSLLDSELKKSKKGTIIIGSVHDSYQKAEEKFQITRDLLKTIKKHHFPCNILTKTDLVLRDIDILSEIDNCIVTVSVISLNETISKIFENNVPLSKNRLQVIKKLNNKGIKAGLAIMPVIPYIVEEEFEKIVKSSKDHNSQFLLHKHLELKGDQKTIFLKILKKHYPDLVKKYEKLYNSSYMPDNEYILKIKKSIKKLCNYYHIKEKI